MSRKKIYIIVVYLGMLRYFEKLIPHLKDRFEVGFLFLGQDLRRTRGAMITYCKEKKYPYIILNERYAQTPRNPISRSLPRLPILRTIMNRREYVSRCRAFLEQERPAKLISSYNTNHYTMLLYREANARNVETIVLQWALAAERETLRAISASKTVLPERFYETIYFRIMELVFRALSIGPMKGTRSARGAEAVKIGVLDEKARTSFLALGYDPSRIQVVGHIDDELVYELKHRISHDTLFRQSLEEKYALKRGRRKEDKISPTSYKLPARLNSRSGGQATSSLRIVVISTCFHHKDIRAMDSVGQASYYYELFKTIRSVFSPTEAEVLFKLHPSEPDIYEQSRNELSVILCTEDARTEELVALSDLYIAHPITTVNRMPRAINMPAIFVNFSGLEFLDRAGNFYDIMHISHDHDDFRRLLVLYKGGQLSPQYKTGDADVRSIEKIIQFLNPKFSSH